MRHVQRIKIHSTFSMKSDPIIDITHTVQHWSWLAAGLSSSFSSLFVSFRLIIANTGSRFCLDSTILFLPARLLHVCMYHKKKQTMHHPPPTKNRPHRTVSPTNQSILNPQFVAYTYILYTLFNPIWQGPMNNLSKNGPGGGAISQHQSSDGYRHLCNQ